VVGVRDGVPVVTATEVTLWKVSVVCEKMGFRVYKTYCSDPGHASDAAWRPLRHGG
jgi:hypothetical protein